MCLTVKKDERDQARIILLSVYWYLRITICVQMKNTQCHLIRCKNMIGPDNKSSAAAEMSNHLVTIDMGQKLGKLCPFDGSCVPI